MSATELPTGHVFADGSIKAVGPVRFFGYDPKAIGGPHCEANYGWGFEIVGVGFSVPIVKSLRSTEGFFEGPDPEVVGWREAAVDLLLGVGPMSPEAARASGMPQGEAT